MYGAESFPFDSEQLKAIPKYYPLIVPPLPPGSTTTPLASTRPRDPPKPARDNTRGAVEAEGRVTVETNTESFSRQSSRAEGYSTQESSEQQDNEDGTKVLFQNGSINLRDMPNRRKESEGDEKDEVEAKGGPREERHTSTGRRMHGLHGGIGRNAPYCADSLAKIIPGAEGDEKAESKELELACLLAQKEETIKDLRKELAAKEAALLRLRAEDSEGGGRGLHPQAEVPVTGEYNQQRLRDTELARLQSIEKRDILLQNELAQCKKDKDDYESQVLQLTSRLSLYEHEKPTTSDKDDSLESVLAENHHLNEEIASLRRDLLKKETNLKKMRAHVNRVTKPSVVLDEQPQSLPSASQEGEGPPGLVREELRQRPHTSQLPQGTSGGQSFGAEQESQLAKLYEEMREKDELIKNQAKSLEKLETTARNLTAMMTYQEKASSTIKSLSEKCQKLEVRLDYPIWASTETTLS